MLEVLREFWNRNKRLNGNDDQQEEKEKDLLRQVFFIKNEFFAFPFKEGKRLKVFKK